MADAQELRHPRRRPGRLQDLRPHPRAAPVGHDHGLDVRLRRAGLHPDRPRQRDEQQLVVREHPRDQPLRRAAAAAVRLVPAGLGQPDHVRARSVHRPGDASTGTNTRKSCACSPACSTTWSRSTACRCSSSATRSLRKRRHGMGFLGLGSTVTMLQMKLRLDGVVRVHRARRARDGRRRLGNRRWRWPRKRARRRSWTRIHGHRRDAAQAPGNGRRDGWKVGEQDPRQRAARAATAATCSAWPKSRRSWSTSSPRPARASPTTARSRPPARSRCRWPTTPRNGIEPSFAHHYSRNVIREGKKSKEKVDVWSLRAARLPRAGQPARRCRSRSDADEKLPDYFISADDITPKEHVDVQAAAQKWVDSLDLQDRERADRLPVRGLQGHLPLRPRAGPEGLHHVPLQPGRLPGRAGQGSGPGEHHLPLRARGRHAWSRSRATKQIEYDGEMHTAANLFDALERRLLRQVLSCVRRDRALSHVGARHTLG